MTLETSADLWAEALIHGRQTILPKRLLAPGPEGAHLERILAAAAAAPDHGKLLPWRFILIPPDLREDLAQVFEAALLERDASATPEQCAQAREKAFRAPVLLLAVARLRGEAEAAGPVDTPAGEEPARDVPDAERLLSAGCALQNMLVMATALGFGSALTSGKALQSGALRQRFALAADEVALTFVSFGTPSRRPAPPQRPQTAQYLSVWEPRS